MVTPPAATGENVIGFPLFHWNATHAPLDVSAGACYWVEITNDVGGAGASWFWSIARTGPHAGDLDALPREGNARIYLDEALDGYTLVDQQPFDLAFCLDVPLSEPACGFETLFDTGPHHPVLFNGVPTYLGWSSGNLDNGDRSELRTAQAFTLPPAPEGSAEWIVRQVVVEGFTPAGVLNESLYVEIFTRTALDVAPTPADSILVVAVPFSDPQLTTELVVSLDEGLPPGDYWLTMWAANDEVPFVTSNFPWFTNAPDGINNSCTLQAPPPPRGSVGCQGNDPDGAPPGTPMMLRAHTYPDPGFGSVTLPQAKLDVPPGSGDDPADLLNTAFRVRGLPTSAGPACLWDCQAQPDGSVGTADLLALLAGWGAAGPCDFDGSGAVATVDLLKLLASWGPCP